MQAIAHPRDIALDGDARARPLHLRPAMRVPVLLLVSSVLFAPPARADLTLFPKGELWLSVGPLFSTTLSSDEPGLGGGAEATLNWFRGVGALGAFGQVQKMNRSTTRLCAGLQGTLFVGGLELGIAHETANRRYAATTALHIAPYLSFVFATVGLRFGIPLAGNRDVGPGGLERMEHPREVGLVLTAKFPIALSKDSVWGPILPWNQRDSQFERHLHPAARGATVR